MSPDLPRDLRFRRSIRKSVSSYPRSAPVPNIVTLVNILGQREIRLSKQRNEGKKIQSCSYSQIHLVLVDKLPTERV